MTARVALVGANGYGVHHRRAMVPMLAAGEITLAGLCDVAPISDVPDAPVPPGVPIFTDHDEMLTRTSPDIVIVATPPHTHLQIALDAAKAGADVLMEKPPLLSLADHAALADVLNGSGRACQVGFQALGSAALAALVKAIADGRFGEITGIAVHGAWRRPDSYYARSPWAGKRWLQGHPVLDGALVNPFAHALMQGMAAAEACGEVAVARVELDRYRARSIDVDDTCFARLTLESELPIVAAVTLCADEVTVPAVTVHGTVGSGVLYYTTDVLALPGSPTATVPGRRSLLSNLVRHRHDPDGVPLIAPLTRTAEFTRFVEAVLNDGPPTAIPSTDVRVEGSGPDRTVTVPGITRMVRYAADSLTLPLTTWT